MLNYIHILRPHHWVKNILIFIPLLASHEINDLTLKNSIFAFIAFSLIASCGYIFNDMVDLKSDKINPYKKKRPLASGKVTKSQCKLIIIFLLFAVTLISVQINLKFLCTVIIYFLLTVIYSIILKKKIILDIIVLSIFYTIRIFAGSQATDILISTWLFTFSIFIFFSLAAVKRQIELVYLVKIKKTNVKGRGYKVTNLPIITMMAICSGYLSIVILAFYINSDEVIKLYSSPYFLWGVCFVLLYWITRIIFTASSGLMHLDPIIYASKDKISYICLIIILFFITASII
tara:strand:- start:2116 stop:2985 length:870 start_codon:yes stop_codon:yes gene_type:complete